jgi:hypothetical protein
LYFCTGLSAFGITAGALVQYPITFFEGNQGFCRSMGTKSILPNLRVFCQFLKRGEQVFRQNKMKKYGGGKAGFS